MTEPRIVSKEEWLSARLELLEKEKELTRLRDEVSRELRKLPWERVEKEYVFAGPAGEETLSDLFAGRSQLIVYHFMFDPEWAEGCKSCSLLADHYNSAIVHLEQRDATLVTVSRAPLETLAEFQRRMGWTFKWVSSHGSDFNRDYHVTFDAAGPDTEVYYNYEMQSFPVSEAPGMSVFAKRAGSVFHTYSTYARGLDRFIGVYHLLDTLPKGRDEDDFAYGMEWVRHHDRYADSSFVDPYKDKLGSDTPPKSK